MFNFRIINTPDGNQIIDQSLKTPYAALTPLQMQEYIEIDNQLAYMERMEKKQRRELERRQKLARNPFIRIACACGIVTL